MRERDIWREETPYPVDTIFFWISVIEDDEDGFEDDEQFVDDTVDPPVDIPAISTQTNLSHPSEIPDVQAVPPPSTFNETTFPAEDSVEEDLPPPPPPPTAAPMPKQEERTPQAKEPSPRPNPISPRSKKIKGLNSRQTVIVVKSAGIFSKLYTISLVFLILAVVSYLVAFALVTFSPEEVGPKLERMGISLKWFGHEGASGDSSPPSEPSSPVPSGPSDTGGGTNNSPTE